MTKKPNIVFILSDDQGFYSLGCLQNSELKTPNLDALAARGLLFSNCYCACPVCSPARASILTGTMPSAHGVHDWIRAGNLDKSKLPLSAGQLTHYDYDVEHAPVEYLAGMPSYTQMLAENGYTCALSGKWHLGDSLTPQCGFTKWYTIGKGGCDNYMDPDIVENGSITFPKTYLTDLITDKAVAYIGELAGKDNPFYLSVHYIAPHTPWEAYSHKKEHLDLYDNCNYEAYYPKLPDHPWASKNSRRYNAEGFWKFQGYEAAVTAMDEGIGKVLDALREKDVLDDTIVVFTSDNGFNLGHHGLFGKGNASYPLNMYDTSVKVPFIISCPAHFLQNTRTNYTISHYDLFPTLLDLAGVPYTLTSQQPGHSFAKVLTGETQENHDVVIYDEYGATRMIRTEKYKYIHHFTEPTHEFYDMEADPGETCNLYAEPVCQGLILEMRKRMLRWFAEHTNPRRDGTKEYVDGSGQLCLCGEEATLFDAFYEHHAAVATVCAGK